MGGHIALELLKHHDVKNLVLFYPGIYTHEAYDLPFDERFSSAIRKENSWQDAAVLEDLKKFQGSLLIIWGENDAVVPRGVVDLLFETANRARNRELFVVPGAEHLLLPELYADDRLMGKVIEKIKKNMQHHLST
jgi:dienelactone hydrolase